MVETIHAAFVETMWTEKNTETRVSLNSHDQDSTEVEPRITTVPSLLLTKVHRNEQGIIDNDDTSQKEVITAGREECSAEEVEMHEGAFINKENLEMDDSNITLNERRYLRPDRTVPVRFAINAIKRVRDGDEPFIGKELAGSHEEK